MYVTFHMGTEKAETQYNNSLSVCLCLWAPHMIRNAHTLGPGIAGLTKKTLC